MTLKEFKAAEPESLRGCLLALWFDSRNNWKQAHETAQVVEDRDGAWVHAYLHRKEGDAMNAAYWYRRAGKTVCSGELGAEWETIVRELLQR